MPISRLWPCLLALMITGCPEPDPSDPDPGTAGADTLDTTDATDTTGADSAPECTSAADCSDTVDTGPCTATVCIDQKCALAPAIGEPCDDGDPCTDKDLCNAESECVGTGYSCEQPDTCLTSACDGSGGCTVTQHEGTCLIEGVCYEEGDTAPDALCLSCSPDTNASEWTAATPSTPCEDDDGCTLDDACTGDGVCVGAWDSTSCGCDSDAECSHLTGACAEGKCLASEHVCVSLPVPGGACDDGDSCTEDDLCQGGSCTSGEIICASCDYEFSDAVDRVTKMMISKDAKVGNALDLNGDGTPDNSMAGIGGLANESLQSAVDEGSVHLLFEHHGLKTNGSLYTVAMFVGELAAGFEECDFTGDYCGYMADVDAVDTEECEALVLFDNASIFQGKLVAGGMKYEFPWQIPLSAETVLDITLFSARVEATVTVKKGLVTKMDGIIGGAIPKESFLAAIDAVPADQLPLPKEMIVQLIQGLVVNDIDTDGNGSKDAASIAIPFEAIPAGIVGME